MQIVIDIPKDVYEEIMVHNRELRESGKSAYYLEGLIQNGTPLPKGHGRKFEEIVVEYPPKNLCTYPEYKGKPYFSIKYEENGEHYIGFGTYKPEVLSRYLQKDFIALTVIEADKEEQDE